MIGRLLRTSGLLLALATATMPGLLAVAEGVSEAAASGALAAHIEVAGGSESCPVAHHAHCAACSLLRHGHTGPVEAFSPGMPERLGDHAPAALALAVEGHFQSSGNPRAPPAA